MRRLIHSIFISALISSLIGCASPTVQPSQTPYNQPQIPTPTFNAAVQGYKLPAFNAIRATGNLDIRIVHPQDSFAYYANPQVQVIVKNRTLYVSSRHTHHQRLPVKIWVMHLQHIYLADNTTLTANNLTNTSLSASLTGHSSLRMRGKIRLVQLLDQSDGLVDIRWIDGNKLLLQSMGNGSIRLAGVINVLTAKVFGASRLDAKYLRAKHAFVQTGNKAIAEILAIKSLSAFASDNSNIYYYKTPKHLTRDSRLAGNVLQMHDWR